jgi:o-succinylbenzoate synthase
VKRSLLRLSLPFREPYTTSAGVVTERELLLLRVESADGHVGYGEAAPFEPYDGIPLERAIATLTRRSRGRRPPQARAAVEMARLDLDARRDGRSVGEPGADAIPVNRTLSAGPPEEAAARAAEGVQQGYSCFKLKVGLPDDEERVGAVREALGSWPALRIDANGAWSVEEAIAQVRKLERFDLQFVEQPCRTLEELAEVRARVSAPICADESVASAEDVKRAAELGACDVVNVKLAPSGGFEPAREALRTAVEEGIAPFLSSTLDGPWGIAAALQLAAGERLALACGLATLELFDAELAEAIPAPKGGLLAVPPGPGFGVEPSGSALGEVLVEEVE